MKIKKITALLTSAVLLVGTTAFAISDTELAEFAQKKTAEYSEIVKDATTKDGDSLSNYLENAIIIPFTTTKNNNRNQFSTYKTSEFYKELYDKKTYYLMTADGDIIYINNEIYPERWTFKPESYQGAFKKYFDSSVIAEILNTADIKTVTDMRIVLDDVAHFFLMYLNTDKGEYAILCDGRSGYKHLPDKELEPFKLYTADEVVEFVKEYLKAEEEYDEAQNKKMLEEGYWEIDENGDDVFIQASPSPEVAVKPTAEPETTPRPTTTPKATVKPTDTPKETIAPKPLETDKPKTLFVRSGDKIALTVGEKTVNFPDAQPFIDGNYRTQIPVRAVADMLDCAVDWDDSTKTASITNKNGDVVKLTIDSNIMTVNEKAVKMDTAAIIREDRTYIPVRFAAEAMGLTVEWEK